VGSDWGDAQGKDWGGSETHDWGLPPPPDSTLLVPDRPSTGTGAPVDEVTDTSDAQSSVRSAAVAAMNNRRHSAVPKETNEEGPTEYVFGSGDATMYAIEDGRDHAMIGRAVGQDADGCVYCLVGRVSVVGLQELGDAHPEAVFEHARDISLSSVFQGEQVTNVVLIDHYDRIDEVPSGYRPPSPFLSFSDT